MKVLDFCIDDIIISGVKIEKIKGKNFLVNTSGQKVKISVKDPTCKELETVKVMNGESSLYDVGTDYGTMIDANINPYSFNPNIFWSTKESHLLMFVTIKMDVFTMLRYYTNCEVISVFRNNILGRMGAIILVPTDFDSKNEPYFVIHGRNKKDSRFASYKLNTEDFSFDYTESLSSKQLKMLKDNVRKYSGKPLQFKYSGRIAPAYAICYESDEIDMRGILTTWNGADVDQHIIVLDDNAKDEITMNAIIGEKLVRTKGLVLGPNVEFTFHQMMKYGIRYLFQFKEKEDGSIILASANAK